MKRRNLKDLVCTWPPIGRALSFASAQTGATAVEFALISLPFFALLMAIFELGLIFLLSTTLDNAVAQSSRHIRTGEYQTGGTISASDFQSDICTNLGWLGAVCSGNLKTDVETFTTFKDAATNMVSPMDGATYDPSRLTGYKDTAPCDIVVVRAYYKWPLIVPGLNKAASALADNSILLTSTVAFRNEPFTASVTSC